MANTDPQALRVLPFRGLRFAPDRVSDPSAVTSPPYDMIGPDEARRLADTEEHNVVRLILAAPEELDAGPGAPAPYHRAATSLREWIDDGVLRQDLEPAFYVYEQTGRGVRQRGLIALVKLDDADVDPAVSAGGDPAAEPSPASRAILPHEAVTTSVVTDRLAQMRATEAHIEPILLTYEGDRTVSDLLDRVADLAEPLTSTTTADGTQHRLWALTDPVATGRIAADLLWHRALIADGHHRHAAYRRLRAERGGPAEYGLALLVDSTRYPLSLHAIHRVLPHVPLETAVVQAGKVFAVRQTPDPHHALNEIPTGEHAFVLSDGTTHYLLTAPDPAVLAETIPADRPQAWRALDATVLHHVLVEAVWQLPDTPEEVRFDHDPLHAVAEAARIGGTAVLLRPTTEDVVRQLAGAGVLMPRKSTAFGPKPATGLVMRLLAEDGAGPIERF
ncbi:uncharacterized protein (DUF1015 family) [Catenulispora sp. GAS73]|uniref:DUF1015 family protein n=1 Tax=Catenulispora sp. GAS73 TaxID=3156269 RepID=UPI0035183A29